MPKTRRVAHNIFSLPTWKTLQISSLFICVIFNQLLVNKKMFKLLAAALLLLSITASASPPKNRVLVLLESPALKQTHSIYLKFLEDRGFQVTLKRADDSNLALIKYGEFVYDHLIIFAPGVLGKFISTYI